LIKKLFNLSYDEERKIELKLNRIINLSKERALQKVADRKPVIFDNYHYGSIATNPKNLVIWYLFEKDSEMEEARNNGLMADLRKLTLEELKSNGYPEEVLGEIYIEFTTDEDIQNTTDGNYYYYFK
jgi:hypothetical protein